MSDTTLAKWSPRPAANLYTYLNDDRTVKPWYASEHLKAGNVDFLAAWNGWGIGVSRMYWKAPPDERDFRLGFPVTTAVGDHGGARTAGVELRVTELRPGTSRVSFEIGLAAPMRARLALYDVMGRRVKVLLDQELPIGRTAVTWDGTDAEGGAVRSGVYFARLSWSLGRRVQRVPFIR